MEAEIFHFLKESEYFVKKGYIARLTIINNTPHHFYQYKYQGTLFIIYTPEYKNGVVNWMSNVSQKDINKQPEWFQELYWKAVRIQKGRARIAVLLKGE